MKHELLKVENLIGFTIREIRQNVIEKLKERISERGYNQAKCLSVVLKDGEHYVADGNHRLHVLLEKGIEEVPCVIYENEDIYKIATECNVDEDTYAPMDLFDWLDVIKELKDFTQEEIGQKINWSLDQVKQNSRLLNKVSGVIDLCKKYQKGRDTNKVSSDTFDFTEYWFRTSGLYDLNPKYQLRLIESFKADKFSWNKSKVQSESAKYKKWQEFICYAENKLLNAEDLQSVIELIENNTFKSIDQLQNKLNDLNKKASNKLICGDSIIELEQLDDNSIDLVITDPPYGIDYSSNRSQFNDTVTKQTILNDGLSDALKLLDKTCNVLKNKTKSDAHLYFFTSYKVYSEFEKIIGKYFNIKNMIVWDKGNHGTGDLDGTWGNRHELIIFATKGKRKINKRKSDILSISKLSTNNMIHPTQKPLGVIKELLEVSAQTADTVCDPFMGSGSTIKAVKEFDSTLNYIGIELDPERFEKAKSFIGGV
jgi:site-specific DNA-methyltransferase (adenine-specific)